MVPSFVRIKNWRVPPQRGEGSTDPGFFRPLTGTLLCGGTEAPLKLWRHLARILTSEVAREPPIVPQRRWSNHGRGRGRQRMARLGPGRLQHRPRPSLRTLEKLARRDG